MVKKDLKVLGMSCHHCKMAIEKEVSAVDGVINVVAFPKEDRVTVEYDGNDQTLENIKQAIIEAGYDLE